MIRSRLFLAALLLSSPIAGRVCAAEAPAAALAPVEAMNQTARDAFNRQPFVPAPAFDAALKFYLEFPDDYRSRGWLLNLAYFTHGPLLDHNLSVADQTAYQAVLRPRLAQVLATPGLSDERWESLMTIEITRNLGIHQGRLQPADSDMSLAVLRQKIDALAARRPKASGLRRAEIDYVEILEAKEPAAVEPQLKKLLGSPNEAVAKMAQGRLNVRAAYRTPMEMSFTAVDGREVDLKRLRGKVVLIDFWATWCGPCIAELPNVKKVYADYHARGFEVVGIALEEGKLAPGDTPAQRTEKLAKAKKVLVDFAVKSELPWPQHFDGQYWQNEISTRYAIFAIPAMFLLDQDGKVVSTNARGDLLEQEVKRLLKL